MSGSFMARVALDSGMVTLLMAAPTTPMMVLAFSRGSAFSASIRLLACSSALIGYNTLPYQLLIVDIALHVLQVDRSRYRKEWPQQIIASLVFFAQY